MKIAPEIPEKWDKVVLKNQGGRENNSRIYRTKESGSRSRKKKCGELDMPEREKEDSEGSQP